METTTIKLSEIIFDETIYPRKRHDPAKVQEYAEHIESIEAAQQFMHISLNNKLLDGRHRHLAYLKLSNGQDREVSVFIHPVSEEKDEYLTAVRLNSTHGQQLTPADKRQNCINLYMKYGYSLDTICEVASVSKSFAQKATKAARDEQKRLREETIFEMWLACHTQEEIAGAVDMSQSTLSPIVQNIIEKVPEYFSNSSFANDRDWKPPLYNVWSFGAKTNKTGHFGNTEQSIVDNLLYLYTEPFDIVVDPFAGGGSTIDVCKHRLRRYWVSDRLPIIERESEIRQFDIAGGPPPLHKRWQDVSLVYLDPPYWRQAENQYSEDDEDLANMSLDDFYAILAAFIGETADKMRSGAHIALIIQPTQWKAPDRRYPVDHVFDFVNLMAAHQRMRYQTRIICPYQTQQYNPQQVDWAKAERQVLTLNRELIVWEIVD